MADDDRYKRTDRERNERNSERDIDRDEYENHRLKNFVKKEIDNYLTGSNSQINKISEDIFSRKLQEFFEKLGYNILDFSEVRRLRKELDYLRTSLDSNLERKSTLLRSMITSTIGAVIGIITSILTYVFLHPSGK